MAEFSRTTYDFNSRFTLNDDTTDTDKYALVDADSLIDTIAKNIEQERPEEPGIVDYGVKLSKGLIEIPLLLYASSDANMSQLIQNIKEAFNPDLLEKDTTYGETTKYNGYHPLDWTEVVGANSRDFRIYAKSMEIPAIEQDSLAGLIRKAKLKLKVNDPRKYTQAQSTVTTDGGIANNVGTYETPVEITITATGATSIHLQISNGTNGKSIYVPIALANTDVLVIDTRHHSVKLNGVEDRRYVADGSSWWNLEPGNNTIVFENNSNCSISVAWRSAWPL